MLRSTTNIPPRGGTLPRKPAAPAPQEEVEEGPREPNLRARFVPLAESRTSAVIAALDYLGQLSQRARYRYTDAETDAIKQAIFEKLTETMEAFRRGQGNKPGFKFRAPGAQEE